MFSKSGDTALVLLVPEAEALVQNWRLAHDPSGAEGMPAHVTVLYPFIPETSPDRSPERSPDRRMDPETLQSLAEICSTERQLSFTFREFGRFPSVLWLDPQSSDCIRLIDIVQERWPERGERHPVVVPHLTITDGADEATMQRAEADVARGLPLQARIPALSLMAFDGGAWICRRQFDFARQLANGETEPSLT